MPFFFLSHAKTIRRSDHLDVFNLPFALSAEGVGGELSLLTVFPHCLIAYSDRKDEIGMAANVTREGLNPQHINNVNETEPISFATETLKYKPYHCSILKTCMLEFTFTEKICANLR